MSLGSSPFDDIARSFLGSPREATPRAAEPPLLPPEHAELDPRGVRIMAIAISGNLPGIAGIWLVQYADRLARQCGPVALLTHDGLHYSGQILHAEGRAMPSEEAGWMGHATRFVRRWIVAAPEGSRADDIVAVHDADIVLLTGADEAAAAAARLKLVDLADAARAKGIQPRAVSVVVLGAKEPAAKELVRRLGDYAYRELDMIVAAGGSMQRIDRIDTTGPVALPGLGSARPSLLSALIHETADPEGEGEFGGIQHFGATHASSAPKSTSGTAPVMGQSAAPDPLEGFLADPKMPSPMSTHPEPVQTRAIDDPGVPAVVPRAPRPAGATPPASAPAPSAPSTATAGAALASLFDDLVLLAPRAAGAQGVEFAADLGGRLHLLSTDGSTRDLRIASAWARNNWLLLATACRELRGGARAVIVEHLFVDNAPDAVPLHGCGLRLHLRVRSASGTTRIDLNDEGSARPE
ncbi:MAG: hypothetical protein O2819_04915 [Planctomycetota bacterium]|nr:hypothetical protein [Planctomycetota bacterium]MDA1105988.1 hypothetical protein [Planctomycetota bacterium]